MLSSVRVGRFTSSSIYLLMKKGRGNAMSAPAKNYIEEKKIELRLQRPLNSDTSSRPTIWGSALEMRLYSLLDPFEYQYCSSETLIHPEISTWAGTPDFLTKEKVADGKCPYTLKSYCQLADIIIAGDVEKLKTDKPEYYWQLISNAIITGKDQAELIIYCPYLSELDDIRNMLENSDEDQNKIAWIYFANNTDLPYLVDGGYYKNTYSITFKVDKQDKNDLTETVVNASKELIV